VDLGFLIVGILLVASLIDGLMVSESVNNLLFSL
jgi:hypothetical protein